MDENLTPIEVIGIAIKSEEDAAGFYNKVAKLVKNELVRAKYESLAKEEASHRQILLNLYKKMTGEHSAPPRPPAKTSTAESGFPIMAVESLEDVLEFAVAREQEAAAFYSKSAKQIMDVNTKQTLEYLADIERGHETMLRAEIEAYKRDRDWYADNPDIQLVGP